jgi:hypothetical protein
MAFKSHDFLHNSQEFGELFSEVVHPCQSE